MGVNNIEASVNKVVNYEEKAVSLDKKLENKYGIKIKFGENFDAGKESDDEQEESKTISEYKYLDFRNDEEKLELLKKLDKVLLKYPKGFIQSSGIKNIHLFHQIMQVKYNKIIKDSKITKGEKIGMTLINGLSFGNTITIAYTNTFRKGGLVGTKTIHHEIYHKLDHKLKGDNAKMLKVLKKIDKDYKYFGEEWNKLSKIPKGFISIYSTKSPNEDQAEVYGYMMTGDKVNGKTIWELAKNDKILAKKIELMEENLPRLKDFWGNKRDTTNNLKSLKNEI